MAGIRALMSSAASKRAERQIPNKQTQDMMIRVSQLKLVVRFLVLACAAVCAIPRAAYAAPCSSPEYRQFDFWLGDWDVYDVGSTKSSAQVRVDRILGGCVVHERYEDENGMQGESFSIYDAGRKVWHQTWVTTRGQLLTIEGGMEAGSMHLAGAYFRDNGQEVRVRGVWTPEGNTVRESALMSSDAGKTWQPWFDLVFRPRKGAGSITDNADAATVARLDEQFQAAVKANDADAIDKILADDFVLVTGSGKTFNKQESLEEARSRTTSYEHQEDTDRTVRLWGDTAVVTAKLWIKGVRAGKPIDYTLWFSDTYARTPAGWKYVFGQASLPLPKSPQ
jgi:ketosteroid isomerase-like protein